MEKKTKELKMGLDAQKSFAQMYDDRMMNKRIGGKMVKLDPAIVQEPKKEISARKPQSPFKIRGESHNLTRIFIQPILSQGRAPLDHRFRRQKTRRNERFQVRV